MQRVLLKKDAIVKSREFGNVRLSSDVEADTMGNKELGAMGSAKRWAGMTDEQRKAHGQMLKEARAKKRAQPEPNLTKALDTLLPKPPPIDTPPKSVATDRTKTGNMWDGADLATPIDLMVQITGKTKNEVIIALREFKASQVKP